MTRYEECIKFQENELNDDKYWYDMFNEETGKFTRGLGLEGCMLVIGKNEGEYRIDREECVERDTYTRFDFTVTILDKDGKVLATDVGTCDTDEKPNWSRFNIRGLAQTRAWQRAIKKAYYIPQRLSTETVPGESVEPQEAEHQTAPKEAPPAKPQAAPQAAPKPAPQAARQEAPQAVQPTAPPAQPSSGCSCDPDAMPEPVKGNGSFSCGACGKAVTREKRILVAQARAQPHVR